MSKRALVVLMVLFSGGLVIGCSQDSANNAEDAAADLADSIGGAMDSAGDSMSDAKQSLQYRPSPSRCDS